MKVIGLQDGKEEKDSRQREHHREGEGRRGGRGRGGAGVFKKTNTHYCWSVEFKGGRGVRTQGIAQVKLER